ncbi:acyl dehydratase [Solibacillus silvestris]|uniref:acyl dehydratase n=1 Tax=Solibacillus silvestris TaxID=76853 RepID=UPI003F81A25E
MFKNFSLSLFFSMAAVTVVIFAPFLMMFHPIFHMEFFSYDEVTSLFIPNPVNLRLVLIACLVLVVMLGILAYKRDKIMYATSALLLVATIGIAYLSTQNYLMISQEQIERHHFFNEQQYRWDELDEVVFEYVVGSNKGDYTFTAKTGERFVIDEKEVHSTGKSQIYHLARENDISYTEREKSK